MTETTEKPATENKDVKVTKEETALTPFSDLDRFFSDFKPFNWLKSREWPSFPDFESKVPKVDILDKDGNIVVKAETPGVDKKDIDVSVSENSVTIKGSTRTETKEEKDNYIHSEIRRGSFFRSIPLPCKVDADKASATFTDGILELTLPKSEEAKRTKLEIK